MTYWIEPNAVNEARTQCEIGVVLAVSRLAVCSSAGDWRACAAAIEQCVVLAPYDDGDGGCSCGIRPCAVVEVQMTVARAVEGRPRRAI